MVFNNGLKFILGATYMDVSQTENNIKVRQLLTERFTGTWAISYRINKLFHVDLPKMFMDPCVWPLLEIRSRGNSPYLEHPEYPIYLQ
jgi:outer membrane receptor for ferrienterochelin and colicins